MRETRADTLRATVLALGLHVLLFAIAFLGIWWTRNTAPVSAAGPVIEAELVSPDALSPAMQRILEDRPAPVPPAEAEPEPQPVERVEIPPFQPEIEPVPQDIPDPQPVPQERIPEPDTVEQDRASAQAIADREAAEREQEERRRQEQIDLTERKRQEQAEAERRRTEMERQRQEQLADIRRRREEAAREAEQAQRKLEQLEAAREAARTDTQPESPPPGNAGDSADLRARYAAALQEAIVRQWTRPETVPVGQRCRIVITQIPGGEVLSAEVDPSCPYDERGRRSIEAAVLKAQPLPYAGFEAVFNRTLILNFEARDR